MLCAYNYLQVSPINTLYGTFSNIILELALLLIECNVTGSRKHRSMSVFYLGLEVTGFD